jgi:hypothetical protein
MQKSDFMEFWFKGASGYTEFRFIDCSGVRGQRFKRSSEITEAYLADLIDESELKHDGYRQTWHG